MAEQGVIDGFEFARTGQEVSGTVPIALLGRLRDQLHDDEGNVDYAVRGFIGPEAKPMLEVRVNASLHLVCQRCLGSLAWRLREGASLLLVHSESELGDPADEDESIDAVVGTPRMDVVDLVEDEILLALPIAPMHPTQDCRPDDPNPETGSGQSAFAALARLKNRSED